MNQRIASKTLRIHAMHSLAKGGHYAEVFTKDGRLVYTTPAQASKEAALEMANEWAKANKERVFGR